MTAFLHKSKASILNLMKSMPDAYIAEEEDFVIWSRQFVDIAVSHIQIGGVDKADPNSAQNTYYTMSYRLGRTEDDIDMKKAVDEAEAYYNAQEKREWVKWAGKTLMPWLHAQIVMEKTDTARVEQDVMDKLRLQEEKVQ
jgi:hypothetical protein